MSVEFIARNIVNQIGDELYLELVKRGVDTKAIVAARQASNDQLDDFVEAMIEQAIEEDKPTFHCQVCGLDHEDIGY